MPSKFYYDEINDETFLNTIYASDIALEEHFANMLFKGDKSRIVYSSNQYAFRKRAQMEQQDYSNLSFPFMNYWNPMVINPDTERFYWNHIAQLSGIFSEQLGRKIRVVPQRIEYEASIWFGSAFDIQVAMSRLSNDDSNETIVPSSVTTYDGYDIEIPLYLFHDFTENEYEQDDYLEQNRIFNQGINFSVDTMFIYDDQGPASLSETLITNFVYSKGLRPSEAVEGEEFDLVVDYFSG